MTVSIVEKNSKQKGNLDEYQKFSSHPLYAERYNIIEQIAKKKKIFFDKKINLNFKDKKRIIASVFLLIVVLILSQYFNYNFRLGGGFFLKLSVILFDNFYLFFLSSFIGLFLLLLLSFEDKDNFLLIILIII